MEIGVCFLHNATQREIKEATKSHRRKTTAARFCVSRKNGGLLAEKQAPPKNKGVLVFPVRTALRAILTGRFGGLYLEIGVCFLSKRNPTRDKRSHEEPQTKNHGRSFLCLSRLLDVTRRKTRTLEKTGGPCFFDNNRPKLHF